jgi:macrolide transport system ATP-binding/permease protein
MTKPEKQAPLIELKNVSRHFQSGDTVVKAIDDISLSIWDGEFVAIMGQSGSGKSTLINILGCLDKPTSGSYSVMDNLVADLTPDQLASLRGKSFGFVFQRYNLLSTASAAENVEIPALYAGLKKNERHARALSLLDRLGLGGRQDHRPNQLSGGQQQRVAIARALMNDPPIILADEPTGALDSQSGEEVMKLLIDLNKEGRTIILITHDEKVASRAKRVIRIQDGKILSDTGVPKDKTRNAPTIKLQDHAGNYFEETRESVVTALRSLHANMFRTALTLLGIVIGVAAVITMLAIGNGSKQKVINQISQMGTNILNIRPGAPGIRSSGDNASLMPADADALRLIDNIEVVVPQRSGRKTLRFSNIDYATSIEGVGVGFPIARDWSLTKGQFFSEEDEKTYASVIILGQTVANNLFGTEDPVGSYVLVGNIPFQVIGVMSEKGAAPWGGDQDDVAYVPYTTAQVRLFGSQYLNSIIIKVKSTNNLSQTENDIRETLIERHGKEDFSVRNTASFLEMATETQNTLTLLLGAVAAISLIVGGIGVMNIMLVSVTERTREIGIRMATGARMRDIMMQFNTESAVVCTIGGVLGVLIGLLTGWIISLFNVAIMFSLMPIIIAFSCAVVTGILFGYIPAKKAARLDPVVALSVE